MPVMEVGNMITLLSLVLVGAAVIRERERGTIEHLLVMPVNAFEIMMAKVLANGVVILAASQLSMWFMVHKIIGVPINGSLAMYAFGVGVYLFFHCRAGHYAGHHCAHHAAIRPLMLPVFMVLLLFSGSAAPRKRMPGAAQGIGEYWPTTQFAAFAQNVIYRGAGLEIVWPNCW